MKKTANVLKKGEYGKFGQEWYESDEKITCEVVGEWSSGAKIWQNGDEQYYLTRFNGHYNFVHV